MGDVTALMMDCITEKSGHTITPMAVSVCITPAAPAPLPIPYPVVGSSIEGITDEPMRTKINGAKIGTVGSVIKTCHGNEPGTLKEVVSLNTTGPCFIIMGAPIVLCELGMMGITGSPCISNKAVTVGAGGSASKAGGTGGAGGGGGGGGAGGGDASGSQGPAGGGGAGGGGSNSGASGPGSSSGAAEEHQCQGGHPIDLVTGYVVDAATDLTLPGMIPLVWKRTYSSSRRADKDATLGPGWAHGFEQRILEDERVITLREAEGRSVHFAKIKPGQSTFHRRERMTLFCDGEGSYRVFKLDARLTYVFSTSRAGGPALLRAIRDGWENTIGLEHDGERLTRMIDTAGREVRVAWKESRIVRLEVRAGGRLVQWCDYAYSASGCLVSAADTLGFADEYEYDRFNRMIATTIKTGARFEYEYEANTGKCRKTWGPKGLYALELEIDKDAKTSHVHGEEPRVITWNDDGMATRIALPDGEVLEETAYDEDGLLVAEVNGAGEGEQRWYDARGNRVRVVDALGNVTAFEYDEQDLPVRKIAPDGLVTTYAHDKGAVSHVAYPSGVRYSISYDERGRPTSIHGPEGLERSFEYDACHNLIAETNSRGARTTYIHDAMGRPTSRTDALGRTTQIVYDNLGRALLLRRPDGSSVQRGYDARGQVVSETDPLGRTTRMEHSGMGVLSKVTGPDGREWTFAYTSTERLRGIKNPRGELYSFAYDDAGRIVEEKGFDGAALAFAYGPAGRLSRVTYPDATFRDLSFDRAGRVLSDDASDQTGIRYQRDRMGRLVGATLERAGVPGDATLLERDAFGRVVVERHGDRTLRFAYDARGRRIERILPNGARTRYQYDAEDALSAVEHDGHRLAFERDAGGREIKRGTDDGRVSVKSGYDAMDRLIEQRVTGPLPMDGVPAVLVQRQWQYDRAGRITRVDDARWGTTTYAHDRVDHLVEMARGAHRETFAYDAAGSLVAALEGLGGRPEAWEIAPGNRLGRTKTAKYTYDARGRRTVKLELHPHPADRPRAVRDPAGEGRATVYVWDVRDRLREVKLPDGGRVVMHYDALGRRVRKEVFSGGPSDAPRRVDFVWDGAELAAEIDSERGARCFVHAPGTFVPLLQEQGSEVFSYVNDHLGMPKELIDPAGKVAWSAAHSAWGRVLETYADPIGEQNRKQKIDSPFRLLGQVVDEDTGLCWTKFRCFDPEVGRWLTPDPLGIMGGTDLLGFDGSPVKDVDPLGLAKKGGAHPPAVPQSVKDQMEKKGLPAGGDHPFVPTWEKNKAGKDVLKTAETPHGPRKGEIGPVDAEGNVWLRHRDPLHGDHWDKQTDGGRDHVNVNNDGSLNH